MTNDYNDLSTSKKLFKVIAGLLPALYAWKAMGSIGYAVGVYVAGAVIGHAISNKYTEFSFRDARRDENGRIIPEDMDRGMRRSLPVFLWAGPVAGAIIALLAFYVHNVSR